MSNAYADLNTFKSAGALNITGSGHDARLLALLEAASRLIDHHCNRRFYVQTATRLFDGDGGPRLAVPDLIGVTSLQTDEDHDRVYESAWASSGYLLYPLNAAPDQPGGQPYTSVVADDAAGGRQRFPAGRATVALAGQWGFRSVTEPAGATLNEGAELDAADATLTVSDGGRFSAGQTLLIGDEQLYVTAVGGNDLTTQRGVNGTIAANHADGIAIYRYTYPGAVTEACLRLAALLWQQRDGAASPPNLVDPVAQRLLAGYRKLGV